MSQLYTVHEPGTLCSNFTVLAQWSKSKNTRTAFTNSWQPLSVAMQELCECRPKVSARCSEIDGRDSSDIPIVRRSPNLRSEFEFGQRRPIIAPFAPQFSETFETYVRRCACENFSVGHAGPVGFRPRWMVVEFEFRRRLNFGAAPVRLLN